MGHSASILATPAAQADDLLAALSLSRTDRPDPDNRGPLSAGVLRDHFILWRNWRVSRPSGPFKDADLARASARVPLLALDVCETTMSASLRSFGEGRGLWSAEASDGDKRPLAVQGPVPREVTDATSEIRKTLEADADPDGGDFEVPVRAFQLLTGHRYDEVNGVPFVVLVSTEAAPRPFWKFWA